MPLVLGFKRQVAAPGSCPSGFNFYACNNAQVVWTGCCAKDPCSTGCPDNAQPNDDDEDDDDASPLATQSPTATTTFATPVSTSGVADATASIDGVSSISSATPSTAQTSSSSSPTSTSLGGNLVPSDVTEDPSTQTLTTYANAVGDEPKSPPHTEESDVPAIIGATLGAVGIVILVFLLVFCFRRRQRKKELRRRRPDVLPYKRDLDNDDDPHSANATAGGTRSIARSHDRKSKSSSQNGSNHEMRSMCSISTRNGQLDPYLNEPTAIPATNNPNEARANSPARTDSVTITDQNRRASYATNASLSDGDPTSWSRYSSINPTQGPASGRAPSRSPSRSPGRQGVMAGPSSSPSNDKKPDPYTGEVRLSRATGSTFTPAQGATTAPTIKISAA